MEQEPEIPPQNADEWSDQQWINWLKATDAVKSTDDQPRPATTGGRVAHSTSGQLLGSAMAGLARALYGPQEEKPAIVVESGEPENDQAIELHLDFEHPDRSFIVLRSDSEPTQSS